MLFGKSYKQINGAMSLQIHENTSIDATAPEGEIVHTHYPRNGRVREGEGANTGKQGIAADVHAEMMKHSRPCFPTEGKRNMREPVIERVRATSIGSEEGGEAFSEGATRAARIDTEEPADMDVQGNSQAIDRQVTWMTPVVTMDPLGSAAVRAGSHVTAGSDGEGELPVTSANILKTQTGKMGEQGGDTHDSDSL